MSHLTMIGSETLSEDVHFLHQLIRSLCNLRVKTPEVNQSKRVFGIEIGFPVGYFSVTGLGIRQFKM